MPKLFARIRGRRALAWLKHRRRIGYQWVDLRGGDDLPPWATYARPSAATYVDAQGVVRYGNMNLALRSQEFDNAAWVKSNMNIGANGTTAPDGTATADALTPNSTVIGHFVQQSVTTSGTVTLSIHAKPNGYNWLALVVNNTAATGAFFNVSTGATASVGGSVLAATATAIGDGWYRCAITVTATVTTVEAYVSNAASYGAFGGDGTSGVYVWGAQLQTGSLAGPYLATTSAVRYAARTGHYVSGVGPLLLLEGNRTNARVWSNDLTNVAWNKIGSSALLNATGPDGVANSASTLTEAAGGTVHLASQGTGAFTAGATQSISVVVKANGRTRGLFQIESGSDAFGCTFILSGAGTIAASTSGVGTVARTRITALANGWYWLQVSGVVNPASTTGTQALYLADAGGAISYSGDGTSGMQVWGMQHEVNQAFASSTIPTTTAAVTRAADALSLPFGPVPQAVTFYKRVRFAGLPRLVWNYGTGGAYVSLAYNSTSAFTQHFNGVTSDASLLASTPALGDLVEMRGVLYADGSTRVFVSVNGGAESTGSGTVPVAFGSAAASPTLSLTDGGLAFDASERLLILPGVRSLTECRMAR